jgi:hypothetical protein
VVGHQQTSADTSISWYWMYPSRIGPAKWQNPPQHVIYGHSRNSGFAPICLIRLRRSLENTRVIFTFVGAVEEIQTEKLSVLVTGKDVEAYSL